jgi:transposase
MGLPRFDGHPPSGAKRRKGCPSWRPWQKESPGTAVRFTPEFKAEIVDACNRGDRSIGQVARDFDLTETAVREWVKQADIDAGRRDGLTTAEREELVALRRENSRAGSPVSPPPRSPPTENLGNQFVLG